MVDAYYTTDESHYNECIEKGTIVPTKDWYGKRFCIEDFLAGDHIYIFMFVNDRYSIFDEDGKDNTFGFVLDAEALVTESNALVGPDLLNEYRALLNECATFSVQQNPATQKCPIDCSWRARWGLLPNRGLLRQCCFSGHVYQNFKTNVAVEERRH